eukprot:4812015-Pyramimonas_sp.AAC.1
MIKAQEQKEAEERAQRASAFKEAKWAAAKSLEEARAAHTDSLQAQYALAAATSRWVEHQDNNAPSSSSVGHHSTDSSLLQRARSGF